MNNRSLAVVSLDNAVDVASWLLLALQSFFTQSGYRVLSIESEQEAVLSGQADGDAIYLHLGRLPADAPTVWVLNYSDLEVVEVSQQIKATKTLCCVFIAIDQYFPFVDALHQRARSLLGDIPLIDMPPLDKEAIKSAVRREETDLLSAIAGDVAKHWQAAVRASETATTKRMLAKPESRQPTKPPATVLEKPDQPSTNATVTDSLLARIDFMQVAAAMGFALPAMYESTRQRLPEPLPIAFPFPTALEPVHQEMHRHLRAEHPAEQELAWVGLFLLHDAYRKAGLIASALYHDIIRYVPEAGNYAALKQLSTILMTEKHHIKTVLARLRGDAAAGKEPLLFALVLRAAMNAKDTTATEKTAMRKDFEETIKRLSEPAAALVDARLFASVSTVQQRLVGLWEERPLHR